MKEIWQKRFLRHQKEQFKYLRLVFNEYFIIAIIFIIGAIGFWYSKAIAQIQANVWWAKPVAILVVAVIATLFQLVTLMEKPDLTFLLPKEKQYPIYFKKAQHYSLIMPILFTVLAGFFMTPVLARGAEFNVVQVALFAITGVLLVYMVIENQLMNLYLHNRYTWLINFIILIIGLTLASYVNGYVGIVFAIVVDLVSYFYTKKIMNTRNLNWYLAVSKETNRSYKMKRFYNMFTDVPGMSAKVSRRRWLDWILSTIKSAHQNTYLYLYARGFLRNTEYSGLFLRLTILGMILVFAIHNDIVNTIVASLFIYLVEFQLIPLFKQYDNNVMTQIYPVKSIYKVMGFRQVMWFVLIMEWILMAIVLIGVNGYSVHAFLPTGISFVTLIGIMMFYLPVQLKKLKNN